MTRARSRWGLLVVLLSLTVLPATGEEDTKRRSRMRMPRKEAPGARLAAVLLPSPASPLVAFRLQFRVGAIDDPRGKEGLNSLTAMTIGKGGTKDLTFRQVTHHLFPMAASIESQPDREVTTFVGQVHRDHLKEFYRIFTGLILAPRFDEADFRRNRDLLLAAIKTNLRGNDDESLGKEALGLFMYEGHPYGRTDLGTVQGLKAITLADVRKHYLRYYTRGSLVFGVAGGYPEGLIETLREDLAGLPAATPPRPPLPKPPAIKGMEVLLVEKPAASNAISIGFPNEVTRSHEDFYALLVANSFLGEHRTFNGRLMNKMRSERALNYGDYSYVETFIQDGGSTFPLPNIPRSLQAFTIWIRPVAPENTVFALRQATRELARLIDRGLSEDEFQQTRDFLLNYSRLWAQSLSRRLGFEMDSRFYGTPNIIDGVQRELPRLKVADVNEAVKRHLTARNLKVAIVTDKASDLLGLLLSGKPTPITYQTPTTNEALLAEDREIESYPLPIDRERARIVSAQSLFER